MGWAFPHTPLSFVPIGVQCIYNECVLFNSIVDGVCLVRKLILFIVAYPNYPQLLAHAKRHINFSIFTVSNIDALSCG